MSTQFHNPEVPGSIYKTEEEAKGKKPEVKPAPKTEPKTEAKGK